MISLKSAVKDHAATLVENNFQGYSNFKEIVKSEFKDRHYYDLDIIVILLCFAIYDKAKDEAVEAWSIRLAKETAKDFIGT